MKTDASRESRTDAEIAHAVANAIDWDIEVPSGITARVEKGRIYLDGSVEEQHEKGAAERAVRYLTGVQGVTNRIKVKPVRVSTTEVDHRIREALHRTAELDASRITVEAQNGKITLKGNVRSWAERTDAERAAWAAPGVTSVEDDLTVGV
jgi:osmotically-inducible protein OsmY